METDFKKDELFDPSHLSAEDLDLIKRKAEALEAGFDTLDDDPIERGLVNGQIMSTIGQSFEDKSERTLKPEQKEELLSTLKVRFEKNINFHKGIEWSQVEARLNEAAPEKLWSLNEMERTGGEPDMVGIVEETGEYKFWDCSPESPLKRRSLCYCIEGQKEAENRGDYSAGNAVDMAKAMGLGGILDESQSREMQRFGKFDLRTESWVSVPDHERVQSKAILPRCAHRVRNEVYVNRVHAFEFHSNRGFRGWLLI